MRVPCSYEYLCVHRFLCVCVCVCFAGKYFILRMLVSNCLLMYFSLFLSASYQIISLCSILRVRNIALLLPDRRRLSRLQLRDHKQAFIHNATNNKARKKVRLDRNSYVSSRIKTPTFCSEHGNQWETTPILCPPLNNKPVRATKPPILGIYWFFDRLLCLVRCSKMSESLCTESLPPPLLLLVIRDRNGHGSFPSAGFQFSLISSSFHYTAEQRQPGDVWPEVEYP